MTDYDFHTLNSGDFETLVRDLLNAEVRSSGRGTEFTTFPAGRDQGIDLLDQIIAPGTYTSIAQVKHYLKTPYKILLSHLGKTNKSRSSEKEKILKLNPDRFILITSQKLTRQNKEEIMGLFSPYIKTMDDVIDQIELNRLLSKHTKVQEDHYKLWFSSRTVFERILNNDIHGRSNQLEEEIKKKFALYVITPYIIQAEDILYKQQFIVVTGEPGNGKTSLAEMLLYRLAGKDYKMYWIDKSISEVDGLLKEDDSKQVFYFDDFLGHTQFEIESSKGQEKGLLFFIRRIKRYSNKYFILTTRTSIINQAALESERFKNSDIFAGNYKIDIKALSLYAKIRIIKNHLLINNVPLLYLNSISTDRKINGIAEHTNFSPRLIEFVTKESNYKEIEPADYYSYIVNQLKSPHEIWKHAYEQQINNHDRFLLTTLFSFGHAIEQAFLEDAFESRLQYEINTNNIQRGDFYHSYRKLLGSFIKIRAYSESEKIDFINPSLEDFLHSYLSTNDIEKARIGNSILFVEQIFSRFRNADPKYLVFRAGDFFYEKLKTGEFRSVKDLQFMSERDYVNIYVGLITWMFYKNKKGIDLTLESFRKADWSVPLDDINYYHLSGFLRIAHLENDFKIFVQKHFENIAKCLFQNIPEVDHLEYVIELFDLYDLDFEEFMKVERNYNIVKDSIDIALSDEIDTVIDNLKEEATSVETVSFERDELETKITSYYEAAGMYITPDLSKFDDEKWEAICLNNYFREEMKKDD